MLGCPTYHGNKCCGEFHVCRHYRSLGYFHGCRSGSYYVRSTAFYTPCLLQRTPLDLLCSQRTVLCSLRRWPRCRWPGNRNYFGWLCVCVRYQPIPFRRRLLRSTHRNRVQYRLWSDTLVPCSREPCLYFQAFPLCSAPVFTSHSCKRSTAIGAIQSCFFFLSPSSNIQCGGSCSQPATGTPLKRLAAQRENAKLSDSRFVKQPRAI